MDACWIAVKAWCVFGIGTTRIRTSGRPGRRKILPLPVDQFLARLLEHVPPPGLQTVRAYGLYASSKSRSGRWPGRTSASRPSRRAAEDHVAGPVRAAGDRGQRVCPVCGAPLVVHGRFPAGQFSRLDQPPPRPLVPRGEPPEPVAQPPPGQAA